MVNAQWQITTSPAILALATAQHRLQRSRDSTDILVAAIARNSDEPESYALLVKLLIGELNEWDEAATWLDTALRVGPNTAGVNMAAFVFFESQGKLNDD